MGGCVCVCSEELGYPKLSSTDINMTFSCTLLPLTALTLLCLLLQGSLATDGLDISIYQGAVSGSTWSCLHSSGFDFAIVQVYDGGSANKDCVGNVEAATSAGFAHVDIYAFLCPTCMSGSGSQQASTVVNFINSEGLSGKFGMIWIDVEPCSGCLSDTQTNADFLSDVASTFAGAGLSVGIYTNWVSWPEIVGSWDGLSSYPVWYPHYDDSQSFSDFESFGGWSSPSIKQFDDSCCVWSEH